MSTISISIIIPTYNRAELLFKTLKSLEIQDSNGSAEVIIIDNGSTDHTKNICLSFNKTIENLHYVYDAEPGLLTGRHLGIQLSKGKLLCFLDDDVELNPDYIPNLTRLFNSNPNLHFATGPCLPRYEIDPPDWLTYFWNQVPEGKYCAWLSLLDFGSDQKIISPNYVWGLNFCCRKSTIITLGGFHPDCIPKHFQQFQGDGETGLTQKAIKAEMTAIYEPNLLLHHYVSKERLTDKYFKNRAFYQGVCNSYTQLRSKNFDSVSLKPGKFKSLRNKLHPYYRWIKQIYFKDINTTSPPHIRKLYNELQQSTQEGYQFHQDNFYSDEKVKSWVFKENYWDFKLPTHGESR